MVQCSSNYNLVQLTVFLNTPNCCCCCEIGEGDGIVGFEEEGFSIVEGGEPITFSAIVENCDL
jgi:hypothetical protein